MSKRIARKEPSASPEEHAKLVVHYEALPPFHVAPTVEIRIVTGEKMTINFAILAPNSFFPMHSHEHEQLTVVTEGAVDWVIDGRVYHAEKGDVYLQPSHSVHGGYVCEEGCTLIDIFCPTRPDMAAKQKEAIAQNKAKSI
jgi:quercetin dioxygenase-like cupin family protein